MTQEPGLIPQAGGTQPSYPPPPYRDPRDAPSPYAPAQPPVPRPPVEALPPPAPPARPAGGPWGPAQPPYGMAPAATAPYGPAPPYGGAPTGPWQPGSPAGPPRRRRTGLVISLIVVGVLVVAGLVVGAVLLFGSKTLDSAKAQSAIAEGVQKQFGVAPTDVHCPSGIAVKSGSTFTCTAKLQGQAISFTVRQTDDKGDVAWNSNSNIAPVSRLQDTLAQQVGGQAGVTATATCETGGRTLLVGATTTPIRCTVTNASDPTDSIQVDASIDAQGHVTYQPGG